jgi:hypothetical protein
MNANPLALIVIAVMWVRFSPDTSYLLIAVLGISTAMRAGLRSHRASAMKKEPVRDLGVWEQFRHLPGDVIEVPRGPDSPASE